MLIHIYYSPVKYPFSCFGREASLCSNLIIKSYGKFNGKKQVLLVVNLPTHQTTLKIFRYLSNFVFVVFFAMTMICRIGSIFMYNFLLQSAKTSMGLLCTNISSLIKFVKQRNGLHLHFPLPLSCLRNFVLLISKHNIAISIYTAYTVIGQLLDSLCYHDDLSVAYSSTFYQILQKSFVKTCVVTVRRVLGEWVMFY